MIENGFPLFELLINCHLEREERCRVVKEVVSILLESNFAAEFIQNSDPSDSTIAQLALKWTNERYLYLEEDEFSDITCLMLSHGLSVTSNDLDQVYAIYDYCELFKILLHMDIKMVHERTEAFSMAELYYDPSRNIEIFFKDGALDNNWWLCMDLLSYFNHPKLKELCLLDTVDEDIIAKAKSLQSVTSLLELSRNMARKFIITRFQIKNSMQFYTVLRSLEINEIYKQIITLERELY